MGRPRTIYVDHDKMLAAIHETHQADLKEAQANVDSEFNPFGQHAADSRWWLLRLKEHGVEIDFERFADRGLTPSERLRHQAGLRDLEARGLVTVYGHRATRAKLTPEGIAKLTSDATTPADPPADD